MTIRAFSIQVLAAIHPPCGGCRIIVGCALAAVPPPSRTVTVIVTVPMASAAGAKPRLPLTLGLV